MISLKLTVREPREDEDDTPSSPLDEGSVQTGDDEDEDWEEVPTDDDEDEDREEVPTDEEDEPSEDGSMDDGEEDGRAFREYEDADGKVIKEFIDPAEEPEPLRASG
jgi:hypothetical protein